MTPCGWPVSETAACRQPPRDRPLLRDALDLEPDAAASHLYLGLALFKAGHFVEALEQFTSTVALNGPFEVHQYMAKAHAALGHADAAGQELFIYEQLKQEHLRRAGPNR